MAEIVQIAPPEPAPGLSPAPLQSSYWRLLLLLALIGALYSQVLVKLVHDWWFDPNFSHGFLVPPFSAYVLWARRKVLSRIPIRAARSGLIVVAASLLLLLAGVFGAELFLSRTSLLFLLAGLAISFLGWKVFRAVLFPWAFLFLMVPIPAIVLNQATFPLQLLASRLAESLLTLLGIPVLREGNVLRLASISLEVAEACSGIRSLMSLAAMAVIYGYFLERSSIRRAVLAIATIPIAVVANAFRIFATAAAAHFWNPQRAVGFFHEFSGWVIFLFSLGLLLAIQSLLRRIPYSETKRA